MKEAHLKNGGELGRAAVVRCPTHARLREATIWLPDNAYLIASKGCIHLVCVGAVRWYYRKGKLAVEEPL